MKKTIVTSVLALCLLFTGCSNAKSQLSYTESYTDNSTYKNGNYINACFVSPQYIICTENKYYINDDNNYQKIISNDVESDILKCYNDILSEKFMIINDNSTNISLFYLPISNAINSITDNESKVELVSSISGNCNLFKYNEKNYFYVGFEYDPYIDYLVKDWNEYKDNYDNQGKYKYKEFFVNYTCDFYNGVVIHFRSTKISNKFISIQFSAEACKSWGISNENAVIPDFLTNENTMKKFLDNLDEIIKNDLIEFFDNEYFKNNEVPGTDISILEKISNEYNI